MQGLVCSVGEGNTRSGHTLESVTLHLSQSSTSLLEMRAAWLVTSWLLLQGELSQVVCPPSSGLARGYLPPPPSEPACTEVVTDVEREVEMEECETVDTEDCQTVQSEVCQQVMKEKCDTVTEQSCSVVEARRYVPQRLLWEGNFYIQWTV